MYPPVHAPALATSYLFYRHGERVESRPTTPEPAHAIPMLRLLTAAALAVASHPPPLVATQVSSRVDVELLACCMPTLSSRRAAGAFLKSDDEADSPVNPADWFACRPGSGPCHPKPRWKPTYNMSESTSLQVCNFSGYQDPSSIRKWGLVDFDWENARGDSGPDGWSKASPMDCGERMTKQVEMMVAAYPDSTSKYMVYRNFVKALPWLTVVREKLSDPDRAYDSWFLNFSDAVQANHSASHVPVCDDSYTPPLCSHLYHDQILTPGNGKGGSGHSGDCGGKRCDVGSVPVGEYLFDFRSANISVKGQTMVDWFIDEYMLGESGAGSDNIVGYYIDDGWAADAASNAHGPSECDGNWQADTGLTASAVDDEIAAFRWVADQVYTAMLARGKFNWNQFLNKCVVLCCAHSYLWCPLSDGIRYLCCPIVGNWSR